MNAHFWNVRGLGNDPARCVLAELLRAHKPDIVAIAEPKILRKDVSWRFWRKLHLTFLDENHRGGGLRPNIWITYRSFLSVVPSVVYKDDQLVVIKIFTHKGDVFFGFVHAANMYVFRRRLWATMLGFGNCNICFMGDFNAIIGVEEQLGQWNLSHISCDEFRQCISDAGLIDMEPTGPFFTWRCSQSNRVPMSRLDRALVSDGFINVWASVSAMVLPRIHSDHHPLLLKCLATSAVSFKSFRFQNFWISHRDFENIVKESWMVFMPAKDPITVCIRKLKRLKICLREWSRQAFGDVFTRLDTLEAELGQLQQRNFNNESEGEHQLQESDLMRQINELLRQQHLLLIQKTRAHWLIDGERNTEFFHRALRMARAKSNLSSIMIDGTICEDVGGNLGAHSKLLQGVIFGRWRGGGVAGLC